MIEELNCAFFPLAFRLVNVPSFSIIKLSSLDTTPLASILERSKFPVNFFLNALIPLGNSDACSTSM